MLWGCFCFACWCPLNNSRGQTVAQVKTTAREKKWPWRNKVDNREIRQAFLVTQQLVLWFKNSNIRLAEDHSSVYLVGVHKIMWNMIRTDRTRFSFSVNNKSYVKFNIIHMDYRPIGKSTSLDIDLDIDQVLFCLFVKQDGVEIYKFYYLTRKICETRPSSLPSWPSKLCQ